MINANDCAVAGRSDSLDAPSLPPGCDERALKAISALHARFISGARMATTEAFTGTHDERGMKTPQPIAKRQPQVTSTNQSDGGLLTHDESTEALRKVLDESAKITKKGNQP